MFKSAALPLVLFDIPIANWGLNEKADILQTTFSNIFLNRKISYFHSTFTEVFTSWVQFMHDKSAMVSVIAGTVDTPLINYSIIICPMVSKTSCLFAIIQTITNYESAVALHTEYHKPKLELFTRGSTKGPQTQRRHALWNSRCLHSKRVAMKLTLSSRYQTAR